MATRVKDLTTKELQSLISRSVKETMEDMMEDMLALSSKKYKKSIAEARKEYKEGKVRRLEDVIDA